MKTIHVLGTGPGIEKYQGNGTVRIGVNDIFRFTPVEFLLILDNIETFPPDRLKTIIDSTPLQTYSHLAEWNFMPGFTPIGLNRTGGDISSLGCINFLPKHVDSTFTAVCLAHWMGAKNIIMYGVEFNDHPVLSRFKDNIQDSYAALYKELKRRGVKLVVASYTSLLAKVVPVGIK